MFPLPCTTGLVIKNNASSPIWGDYYREILNVPLT